MRNPLQILGSKVALAIIGALLIGGVSAVVAAGTVTQHPNFSPIVSASASPAATGASSATSNPQATATTQNAQPTDTPTSPASSSSTPTTTPTGQAITLQGTIATINRATSSFTLRTRSGSHTIVVNGNTAYQGSAGQFSNLQTGWQADVTAQLQSDGTYLASVVNANPGDN